MKLNFIFKNLVLFLFAFAMLSCSDDDNELPCEATEISMKINGVLHTFDPLGYGIDMIEGGHRLQLNFYRNTPEPFTERNLVLAMLYKQTGHNVVDELLLSGVINGDYVETDLVNADFTSDVFINRATCFYATFSGKIVQGGETLTITDGKISYQYEDPFDE